MRKLFIGNLSYDATEASLVELITDQAGVAPETVKIITDRETGRSRGFAFAEMPTPGDAQKAIEALNGVDWMRRQLAVNLANNDRPERGGGGGGGRRGRDDRGDRFERRRR